MPALPRKLELRRGHLTSLVDESDELVRENEKLDGVDVEDVRDRLGGGCESDVNAMALTCVGLAIRYNQLKLLRSTKVAAQVLSRGPHPIPSDVNNLFLILFKCQRPPSN
jgi:hypothetical protein